MDSGKWITELILPVCFCPSQRHMESLLSSSNQSALNHLLQSFNTPHTTASWEVPLMSLKICCKYHDCWPFCHSSMILPFCISHHVFLFVLFFCIWGNVQFLIIRLQYLSCKERHCSIGAVFWLNEGFWNAQMKMEKSGEEAKGGGCRKIGGKRQNQNEQRGQHNRTQPSLTPGLCATMLSSELLSENKAIVLLCPIWVL